MNKRNIISILLYPLGTILFILSNLSVVSGSPINLSYSQRVVFCGAAVCAIGAAPFIYQSKTKAALTLKFAISAVLIGCIFAFGGFAPNYMA